jgi:hypothetical protein
VRHGKVTPNITHGNGTARIKHLAWHDWFDADVKASQERNDLYRTTLKGYLLTRPADTPTRTIHDCAAHIMIIAISGGNYVLYRFWICEPDTAIYFETLEELEIAVNDELSACAQGAPTITGNPTLPEDYYIANSKFITPDTAAVFLSGPLPWLLAWGAYPLHGAYDWKTPALQPYHFLSDIHLEQRGFDILTASTIVAANVTLDNVESMLSKSPWMSAIFSVNDRPVINHGLAQLYRDKFGYGNPVMQSKYLVQYDWTNADAASGEDSDATNYPKVGKLYKSFPWPETNPGAGAAPWVYVSDDFDLNELTAGADMYIGQDNSYLLESEFGEYKAHMKFNAKSFDTTYNTIEIDTDYKFEISLQEGLVNVDAEAGFGPVGKGWIFNYIPQLHDIFSVQQYDELRVPWQIRQSLELEVKDPLLVVSFFQSLFGDTTVYTLPERYVLDYVPDILRDTVGADVEQSPTINWFELQDLIQYDLSKNSVYKLNIADDFNVKKIFKNFLTTHGIGCTWYMHIPQVASEHFPQFRMGFRKLGLPNITDARQSNRLINNTVRLADKTPKMDRAITNQYDTLVWQGNWNGDKFLRTLNIINEGAQSAVGGRGEALKIEDKITHITGLKTLETNHKVYDHFSNGILAAYAYPDPTITLGLNFAALLNVACGMPVLVTESSVNNPFTGARGITNMAGLCVSYTMDLGKGNGENVAKVQLAPGGMYGWAPAVRVAANNSTIVTPGVSGQINLTGLVTDPESTRSGGFTDLAFFDCYQYNETTAGTPALNTDCGCSNYGVLAWQENVEDLTNKILPYTIGNVNLAAGTASLFGDTTNWDTTKAWIIGYDDYDSTDLQDCQKWYVVFADKDGEIDNGTSNEKGHRFK